MCIGRVWSCAQSVEFGGKWWAVGGVDEKFLVSLSNKQCDKGRVA